VDATAHVGWAVAGLGLVAAFVVQRRWRVWLVLPVAASLPALLGTGDVNAALAAFLAIGITVMGAWLSVGAGGRRIYCSPRRLRSYCCLPRIRTPRSGYSSWRSSRFWLPRSSVEARSLELSAVSRRASRWQH